MEVQHILKAHKATFDEELEKYLDRIIQETKKRDLFVAESLEYIKRFTLSGGKRLRSILMYYGYLSTGSREREKMIHAALSVELIHVFLLIHDDIIDHDEKRHGVDTVHKHYQKIGRKLFQHAEDAHFGNSIALIMGDMMHALGNQVLFESNFEPALIIKTLTKLQSIVALTVIGQTKDVYIEYAKQATEEEILLMYEYKTARYTIEGPLHLGAILGGASELLLEGLSAYAIPIGIAFQIQDDILGIFGSEEKLGKPVGSDIMEGKWTLLVSRAMKVLSRNHQEELLTILQKGKTLTQQDTVRFRQLIQESGSLEYSQSLVAEYISTGRKAVLELESIDQETKDFLIMIADYMSQRES